MQFFYTCFTVFVLLAINGCQKDDNFLIKGEAFSVITSGFNGSSNELEITIDTLTLSAGIPPNNNFKRTDRYTFPDAKDEIKFIIREKGTGSLVYEQAVKRGAYTLTIDLIYVNGKLVKKPVAPDSNPEGARLISYLFLPLASGYSADIDIVYYKRYDYIENGYWKFDRLEELKRVTVAPYTFSAFLEAAIINGGQTEIDGKIYRINPEVRFCKAGTDIRYHEGTGITIAPNVGLPVPNSAKPEIVGIMELGTPNIYIDRYQEIKF